MLVTKKGKIVKAVNIEPPNGNVIESLKVKVINILEY